jgi:hypothetical protein
MWLADEEEATWPTQPIQIPLLRVPQQAGADADRPPRSRAQHRRAAAQAPPQGPWGRFTALPGWARLGLVLLAAVLLPVLLIPLGVAAATVGLVGLFQGSVPQVRVRGRAAAAAALLGGLAAGGAGLALASAVLPGPSSPPTSAQHAAPATSAASTPGTDQPTPVPLGTTDLPSTLPPTPSASPTPTASTSPSPSPTAASTTPASLCGAPANPYGYNFCGRGGFVQDPPADICNYFACAPDFSKGGGRMVECQDLTYGRSHGPGSCSRHGGILRPLYAGP